MHTVQSADGTTIAFQKTGKGPPLVLVHGTTADHTRWAPLLPEFERHFTVFSMDRRGRGESGDKEPYGLEMEFADVAAVVEAAGPQVDLLGHSYGALCAMEAALLTNSLRKLILYEPPFPVEGLELYAPGTRDKLQGLLDAGDREGLLTTFFRDVVAMSDREIDMLRAEAAWAARLAAAHTAVREMADADYEFDDAQFRHLAVPTLLLSGDRSPQVLTRATERVAAALPNSRIVVMKGQGHVAMRTAPEIFMRAVLDFLTH